MIVYQLAAGGADKCNPVSVTAFTTLLAAAGPCEQQDSADAMIDLAKTLNNDADMIKFAQIFAQQPRNTVRVFALRCVRWFAWRVRSECVLRFTPEVLARTARCAVTSSGAHEAKVLWLYPSVDTIAAPAHVYHDAPICDISPQLSCMTY